MAANLDIAVEQGSTWKMKVTLEGPDGSPHSIQGYDFEGGIKQTIYDDTIYPFSYEIEGDGTSGIFWVLLPPDVSESIDFQKGVYYIRYVSSPTEKYRMFQGDVTISLG